MAELHYSVVQEEEAEQEAQHSVSLVQREERGEAAPKVLKGQTAEEEELVGSLLEQLAVEEAQRGVEVVEVVGVRRLLQVQRLKTT